MTEDEQTMEPEPGQVSDHGEEIRGTQGSTEIPGAGPGKVIDELRTTVSGKVAESTGLLSETPAKLHLNQELASKLFEVGYGYAVAANLDKFQGLNHQEIALKLFEAGMGLAVAENLDKFQELNHQKIALKLIEVGCSDAVANNLDKFQGLNQEIALMLIKDGYVNAVVNNIDKF